ncbi:MAG: GAF domain-containing protein [Bacteroidia bacterium]
MADSIHIPSSYTKEEKYEALLPMLKGLIQGESSLVANLGNISAALKETFSWFWVGFYLVEKNELVLGPFQGPVACTRISYGKGVCGTAWKEKRGILVPDVDAFPGHIACSSASRSEMVIPILQNKEVIAVLDADSQFVNHFNETDLKYGEQIAALIQKCFLSA